MHLCCSDQCFLLLNYKDLKVVPSFSFFLSFFVSQMAILLTAAKKTLPSTVHLSPGMFVELFELQPSPPPPVRRRVPFKLTQKWHCLVPRELNGSLSSKHITAQAPAGLLTSDTRLLLPGGAAGTQTGLRACFQCPHFSHSTFFCTKGSFGFPSITSVLTHFFS